MTGSLRIPLALAALLVLVGFAYREAPSNVFHLDDGYNIVDRKAIHVGELTIGNLLGAVRGAHLPRRPLANLSLAVDWWRGGGNPRSFQWTNVALHLAAAAAVFWLLLLVLRRPGHGPGTVAAAAFLGAALWACHPIQVQGVTYVIQRMTSMAALFTVLTVVFYLLGRATAAPGRRLGLYLLSALAFLLGMAAKEIALIAPFLVLLVEYGVCRHRAPLVRRRLDYLLLALPALVAVYVAIDVLSGAGPLARFIEPGYAQRDFTLAERLLTQPRVVAFHLSQVLWPHLGRFSLEHDFTLSAGLLSPPSTALALTGVVLWCAAGVGALFRARWRLVGAMVLWVPATLAVESTIMPLEMVFEHRMYLPLVGIAGLAALVVAPYLERPGRARAVAVACVVAVPIMLAALTAVRVPDWRDQLLLAEKTIEHAPGSARAWANLGNALSKKLRFFEADGAMHRALELDPEQSLALHYLSIRAIDRGELARAEKLLSRRLVQGRIDHGVLNTLGELRLKQSNFAAAVHLFLRAVAGAESVAHYRWNLARAYERLGACGKAREQWLAYLGLEARAGKRRAVESYLESKYQTHGGVCFGAAD